ncbi:MAG: hypothetical protein ACI8UX_001612 [Psychromonas sp.]|jgi:hypothetical protein
MYDAFRLKRFDKVSLSLFDENASQPIDFRKKAFYTEDIHRLFGQIQTKLKNGY